MTIPRLEYANLGSDRKTFPPSRLAIVSLLMFISVAFGEVLVWVYSYWMWGNHAYRIKRTHSRLVDAYDLVLWGTLVYAAGAGLAILAMTQQRRRRSLTIFALALNVFGIYMLQDADATGGGPVSNFVRWAWKSLGGEPG